jgi:hypothetical protein
MNRSCHTNPLSMENRESDRLAAGARAIRTPGVRGVDARGKATVFVMPSLHKEPRRRNRVECSAMALRSGGGTRFQPALATRARSARSHPRKAGSWYEGGWPDRR